MPGFRKSGHILCHSLYETQEMAEIPVGGDILITIKEDFVHMFTHHAIKCYHY